jgi:hypothetical protein
MYGAPFRCTYKNNGTEFNIYRVTTFNLVKALNAIGRKSKFKHFSIKPFLERKMDH